MAEIVGLVLYGLFCMGLGYWLGWSKDIANQ